MILPGRAVEKSDMPEKDKEPFTVSCDQIRGQLVKKPNGFIVDESTQLVNLHAGYFPKCMSRC